MIFYHFYMKKIKILYIKFINNSRKKVAIKKNYSKNFLLYEVIILFFTKLVECVSNPKLLDLVSLV